MRIFITTFIFTVYAMFAYGQTALADRLRSNLEAITLQEKVETAELRKAFIETSDSGRYNDVMILQLFTEVTIPDDQLRNWMDLQLGDGSWPDIDYQDTKRSRWEPMYHTTRIQAMTKVFRDRGSSFYGSGELSASISKAMDFWFGAGLRCPNWWYNQIGVPKMMAPAFLLFWSEMSEEQKAQAIKLLDNARFGMTGQNKVWLAGIVLIRGVILGDEALIREARDQIASEIYMDTKEGLQPDFSFHQHGAMMQFGNYGLAYINSMAYWARVFYGTQLAFDPQQIEILRNYMYQGIMWCVWRGYFDPNASGRQVFLNSQRGKAYSLAVSAMNMSMVDREYADIYNNFLKRNLLDPSIPNDLVGNRYFFRSDYGIQRTPDWFVSVRMHSARTLGYEIGNGENLKGFYSSDGATIIMSEGGEYDNIYPIWDWHHLPGTTVTMSDSKPAIPQSAMMSVSAKKEEMNRASFVGGVSNGEVGCMAMDFDRDSLNAKKAYFFIGGAMICLGNSITTLREGATVHTTIDQAHLRGDVLVNYFDRNKVDTLDRDKTYFKYIHESTREDGLAAYWFHHGGNGYIVLNENRSPLVITQQKQHGNWRDIATMYKDIPSEGHVFKAYLDHGTNTKDGSYAYAVLPGRTVSSTAVYAKNPEFVMLSNTPQCQAVTSADGQLLMAVFYEAGKIELPGRLSYGGISQYREFEVDKPCVVMVAFSENGRFVVANSIASPDADTRLINLKYTMRIDNDKSKIDSQPDIVSWAVRLNESPETVGRTLVIDEDRGH